MKKEPKVSAKQVLEALGGKDNIETVSHCATRLRLTVKDESIIDKKAVEDAEGVAGYFVKSGQHQVIFGTGYVVKVCTEFKKLCGMDNDVITHTKETTKNNKNTNKFQDITRAISDVFIPIIPVLLATGILMGLQGLITTLGYNMSAEFNSIFSVLTGTAYTFIPVLVTWSACKKFGGSPVLGIVLGLMLVSPSLPNKWDVVNGAAEALKINIVGIDFSITGYQSSVIPALFLGWFCAFIENKLRKIVPDILDMLIVPFVTLLTSLLLGLFIVGPILLSFEQLLTNLILSLLNLPFGIGGAAGGALSSILNLGPKGTGASMVPGMLLYLNGGMLQYILVLAVSIGVAFAITYVVMKGKEK